MNYQWTIEDGNIKHSVSYDSLREELLFDGRKIIVDRDISDSTGVLLPTENDEARLVTQGKRADLVLNGKYLSSGKEFVLRDKKSMGFNTICKVICLSCFISRSYLGIIAGLLGFVLCSLVRNLSFESINERAQNVISGIIAALCFLITLFAIIL